jgi:DNA polymerase
MIERDVILREIGLTPIWRPRRVSVSGSEITQADEPADVRADVGDVSIRSPRHAVEPNVISGENEADRAHRIASLGWDELTADIATCTACKLCKTRTNTVPGTGDRQPDWVVIGEGPGENEDKQGEPFVGRAGQLLDQMLEAVGKSRRKNVFIANVVKCRPPGNRDPESEEIAACAPYLERQLSLAQPRLILAVGKFAGQQVLNTDATVGAMRSKPGDRRGVPVVVTYHPAYLLRSPLDKAKAWSDLVTAKRLTDEATKR